MPRICLLLIPACLLALLAACAGKQQSGACKMPPVFSQPGTAVPNESEPSLTSNQSVELAGIPALPGLDLLPVPERSVRDLHYDLLTSPPAMSSGTTEVVLTGGVLSMTPPAGEDQAWAVLTLGLMPTDGSAYPTRLGITASTDYFVLVSDYANNRWRLLEYKADGEYSINGRDLVSPNGNFHIALVAWQKAVQFSGIKVTTNEAEQLELWFYMAPDLWEASAVAPAVALVERAAAAGYTTVLLAERNLNIIDLMHAGYIDNLKAFKAGAEAAGVRIVPATVPIGYSGNVMAHDPNLIEPQPVYDCVFEVDGTIADAVQPAPGTLVNGGFEDSTADDFTGWEQPNGAGVSTFADTTELHSGAASIRFDDYYAGSAWGDDYIYQTVDVEPWNCYIVTYWLKTENVSPTRRLLCLVYGGGTEHRLSYNLDFIDPTEAWTEHHLVFNSQDHTSVALALGIWGGDTGRFWIDDVTLTNAGLINVVRRSGTPVTVTSLDGTIEYTEGLDYETIVDPLLGMKNGITGWFDLVHERPLITLTPGSAIADGQQLLVDYYHAAFVYYMQPACCLTDDGVYDVMDGLMRSVYDVFEPDMLMVSIDELRCANWCADCRSTGLTAGGLLAQCTGRIDELAGAIDPDMGLAVWSDMYDPYHNAVDGYYLVNTTLEGSIHGLPADWVVHNWNFHEDAGAALDVFVANGNRQVLAGYYDYGIPDPYLNDWLDAAASRFGIYGVMYSTWGDNYDDLEAWAGQVRSWEAEQ